MRAIAVVFLALAGCSVEEEDFPFEYSEAVCSQERRCDRGSFESTYASMDECVDAVIDVPEGWENLQELFGNDYDEEVGTECVRAIRQSDCAAFEDGDYLDVCTNTWN